MAISHASSGVFPLLLLWITAGVDAVDKNNFKKCEDSSFCRNNRAIQPGDSPYLVVKDSIAFTESSFDVHLLNKKSNVLLNLKLQTLQKNTARFRITEVNPIRPRYEVKDVLIKEPVTISYQKLKQDDESLHIGFNNNSVILTYEPFRLDFLVDNEVAVSVNSRGLMNFEEYREKRKVPVQKDSEDEGNPPGENEEEKSENEPKPEESEEKKVEEVMEEENWEENFKEHRDTRPRGPCSVGLDISFLGVEHVYGIPEHADSLALKTTVGSEPYRLYNLDVFEYELDSRMALYGSIPVMIAHSAVRTVGVFWMNAAETWVDISSSNARKENEEVPQVETHWMSESGIIDVFVMLGPKPHDVFQEYASFTGTTGLPPIFGIAYHQSRWNYNDEDDVKNVDKGFDEHDIPYDVLWLDIEHTDGKKYMTWDKLKFPTPDQMQKNLAAKGRKMVTIIDPHIKREGGYHIHEEASRLGYYIKNKDGGEYDNWCWPGSSSWIDFTNPEIRKWWASKFALSEYQGSTETLFTWNDMNEPSVFHGPEITMHKDALHHGDWEHRDVHNIYGFYQHMATNQGQIDRSGGRERPFVLSRAFFAGTQRHGPIWTGDNIANWDHLKASLPMVLTLNLVGLPFSGADVGGFFNNPDPELLVRWYQAAAFMPFFRAHAHLDTKRREPWLYEDHHKKNIRDAIRMRYTMLPYWYTLFYHASDTGAPLVRPLWVEYPEEKNTFAMEDEFLLGKDLLVKPVTTQGQNSIDVYLPGKDEYWYDLKEYKIYRGQNTIYVPTSMETIPLFQRGGSIIPTKQRVRRCSALMHKDPYTLTLALNSKAEAEGNIYVDDGHTFDYKNGAYVYMKFTFRGGRLIAKNVSKPIPPQPPSEESGILASMWNFLKEKPATHFKTDAWIERIVILGISNSPKVIILTTEGGETRHLQFKHDSSTNSMTIKKPAVNIAQEWTISMHA